MKINDAHQKLLEAYLNQAQAAQENQQAQDAQQQKAPPANDRVDLSSGSRLMQQVNNAMNVNEPGRAEKVDALRQQVQQGTYQVDAGRVADKMMADLLKDLG